MGRKTWTTEQERLLEKLYPDADMAEMMSQLKKTALAIKCKAERMGLRKNPGFVKVPKNSPWREIDIERFKELFPKISNYQLAKYFNISESAVGNKAHLLGLRKNDDYENTGRFNEGQEPWNKGMTGLMIGGEKTRFKKGHVPANTKKDGDVTIRVDKCGRKYKWIRIDANNWCMYHVYLYEQHHGPVPDGCVVIFRNKNRMDVRIENLRLVTRAELMKLNQNREKFRRLIEIEKTRLAYGMDPKSGLGRRWMKLRSKDNTINQNK